MNSFVRLLRWSWYSWQINLYKLLASRVTFSYFCVFLLWGFQDLRTKIYTCNTLVIYRSYSSYPTFSIANLNNHSGLEYLYMFIRCLVAIDILIGSKEHTSLWSTWFWFLTQTDIIISGQVWYFLSGLIFTICLLLCLSTTSLITKINEGWCVYDKTSFSPPHIAWVCSKSVLKVFFCTIWPTPL